ncbi:hypothetical protein Pcinc_036145 [Petrolisthes cinctipes]|uniref:Uncharacterized protein n=1 Tax=Petrolisthes cinctipes TaxID=88211 RepID=A0AAE1BVH4_PETCI|nr:hypothetical protein Pcinc_036145 [Petrolisthes cinctipes]
MFSWPGSHLGHTHTPTHTLSSSDQEERQWLRELYRRRRREREEEERRRKREAEARRRRHEEEWRGLVETWKQEEEEKRKREQQEEEEGANPSPWHHQEAAYDWSGGSLVITFLNPPPSKVSQSVTHSLSPCEWQHLFNMSTSFLHPHFSRQSLSPSERQRLKT